LGGILHSGPVLRTFARENRSRRNLHGNQEEGKKEETLIVCETILRTGREFQPASQEKHLLRGVSFLGGIGECQLPIAISAAKFSTPRARVCHNIQHASLESDQEQVTRT